jgi:hypothetical protein
MAVRHGDRRLLVRDHHGRGHGEARLRRAGQAFDQGREVRARVGEEVVDAAQAQGREQRFGRSGGGQADIGHGAALPVAAAAAA